MLESKFQEKLIREIEGRFPGAIVLKNDSSYIQGFPDLIVLYKNHWAVLEVKNDRHADHHPNQDYYVDKMNDIDTLFESDGKGYVRLWNLENHQLIKQAFVVLQQCPCKSKRNKAS